jgi:PD-(D/E)XK nuclease superfamily protein
VEQSGSSSGSITAESSVNTKQRGDIAEQAAVLEALKRGWSVLRPIGDNLPYDLVFDVGGRFAKVQVKSAWFDTPSQNHVVDNRRTKTNRRQMIREEYKPSDFDFALVYLPEKSIFYVYPVGVFISFGSEIHMVEAERRQRRPRSSAYRDAWDLITAWAPQEAIPVGSPVKFGEAVSRVIPSQVPLEFRRERCRDLMAGTRSRRPGEGKVQTTNSP